MTKLLLNKYRKLLAERASKVYLVGESQSRDLKRVFVELNVIEEYQRPSTVIDPAYLGLMDGQLRRRRSPLVREDQPHGGNSRGSTGEEIVNLRNRRVIKPDELLRRRMQAMITGAPGCGKTTLLKYLTLRALANQEHLPLFLELKTVTESHFEEAKGNLAELMFIRGIADPLQLQPAEREQFREFYYSRLAAGGVMIFLDGLDEVSGTGFFPSLCTCVGDFARSAYRNNNFVISSRPYALRGRIEGLKEMEIAPLTQHQIKEFLRHYYGNDVDTKRLAQNLDQYQQLRELARFPFLLSVISQLYHNQNQIIEHRLELYRQIALHLAIKLDGEKSLPLTHFNISDPDGTLKLDFLKHVACERMFLGYVNKDNAVQDTARLVFTGDMLLEYAKGFLKDENLSGINPRWLAADVKATPLLREVGSDYYAFAHLTIQEYLAAVALSKRENCESAFCNAYFNATLAEMEVLPMLLGLARESNRLYAALEQLPESLNFINLRIRARSLAYASQSALTWLPTLSERLVKFVSNPSSNEHPYFEIILRSFSAVGNASLEYVANQVAVLLGSGDSSVCQGAARALGYIGGERAAHWLTVCLNHSFGMVRRSAVEGLGQNPGEIAVNILVKVLRDDDKDERWKAAEALKQSVGQINIELLMFDDLFARRSAAAALGRSGDNRSESALIDALNDKEFEVRRTAAEALGQIGSERAEDALLHALVDENHPLGWIAAEILGRGAGHDGVVERLCEALRGSHSSVRWRAAEALGRMGTRRAVDALVESLESDRSSVRESAATALGRARDGRAVPALLRALDDKNSDVRWRSAQALGQIGDRDAVDALLKSLDDNSSSVSSSAVEALGLIRDERSAEALFAKLRGSDATTRSRAAQALGKLRYYPAVDTLIEALQDRDYNLRCSAAKALGLIGARKAVESLLKVQSDENTGARVSATIALGRIGDDTAVNALIETLQDTYAEESQAAAISLGSVGGAKAIDALLKALEFQADNVRATAARALGQIGESSVVGGLLMALQDTKGSVRLAATEALGQLSDEVLSEGMLLALSHSAVSARRIAAYAIGYYSQDVRALRGLERLAVMDPADAVRDIASEMRDKYKRKLQLSPASGENQQTSERIVIVTALEEERDALLKKFLDYRKLPPNPDDIRHYFSTALPFGSPNGIHGNYNIITLCLLGMGHLEALNATKDAINRWRPRYVFLVGIAGGIKRNGVSVGDVLISDQVIDYELQSVKKKAESYRFSVHRAEPQLVGAAQNFLGDDWLQLISIPRPYPGVPKRHVGPIATGNKVIETESVIDQLLNSWPKLIGIEMEAGGVASGCFQAATRPGFFMVRGVSDLADENKQTEEVKAWRSYACDVAASYAIALLQSGPTFPSQPND